MNTVPTLGWVAVGFAICFVLVVTAVLIVDPILIWTGRKTISRRCLEAGQRNPAVAVFIAAVLAMISGLLIGHLFLGQAETAQRSASCRCKACVCSPACRCDDKTPAPVAAIDAAIVLAQHHPHPAPPHPAPPHPAPPHPAPPHPAPVPVPHPFPRPVPVPGPEVIIPVPVPVPVEKLRLVVEYNSFSATLAQQVFEDYRHSPLRAQLALRELYPRNRFAIVVQDCGGNELHRQMNYAGGWQRLRDVLLSLRPLRAAQPVPDAKPILLGFKQRINPTCVRMQRELEQRPDVKKAINAAYDVRLYDWVKDKDQCDKYAVRDVPTAIVLDGDTLKERKRFVGYKSPNEILRWLDLPCPH